MQAPFLNNMAKQLLVLAPKFARGPLSLIPFRVKAELLARLLGQLLSEQSDDDELAFLKGNWVAIDVVDMGLLFEVSFDGRWLVREPQVAAVTFSGDSKELILVAAGKEDPDTLFFQRKLSIEGDTELGLEVKNLLLSIEFDTMPSPIRYSIEKIAKMIQQLQLKANPESV
ncbi:SCP2 sterol-binding domain-containing protein [Shewanella sp. D64]|uniref:ubiquinone anaerobic biosynthesis accessory factor UbiT n=1 Tax=unclassified Shewanella TaxID=196818 RepID=UPI0022BA6BF3|nr:MULTISPECIES: SCP2 sterol-binding domain-containing protein [unclassified Shewanella]MEC4726417.1 SCP2 sterol-binding domain-containing protein [Shewanella sp. D64]MEC4738429.1 SCP2 sterol-binding domain-containing protein [Shewanella sp. E94]WBJ94169.1 SCP2 sterol-binding domain-containing protein [Shewanella sp. MTB7]